MTVIWTTCFMASMVWSWDSSNAFAYSVYGGLLFAATTITVVYMYLQDPIFHQVAYAFLTGLVVLRSIYLLQFGVKHSSARKDMWWTIAIGVGSFVTGFMLWIIDNECCDILRSIRHQIGMPGAFLLGNSLKFLANCRTSWVVVSLSTCDRLTCRHILTGLGVYYYIQFLLYLRICLEGNRENVNFIWKFGWFPHVDQRKTSQNGV